MFLFYDFDSSLSCLHSLTDGRLSISASLKSKNFLFLPFRLCSLLSLPVQEFGSSFLSCLQPFAASRLSSSAILRTENFVSLFSDVLLLNLLAQSFGSSLIITSIEILQLPLTVFPQYLVSICIVQFSRFTELCKPESPSSAFCIAKLLQT